MESQQDIEYSMLALFRKLQNHLLGSDALGPPQQVRLFADDLDDHSLLPLSIELGIEDSLPSSQIELALRDRKGHRLVEQEALEMRIAVVFASFVMSVVRPERG